MTEHFMWQGQPLATMGELLAGAIAASDAGQSSDFLADYRAHTEHADANLGYLIGYVEPPERRRELYAAFAIGHPILGGAV